MGFHTTMSAVHKLHLQNGMICDIVINSSTYGAAYMRPWIWSVLLPVMACRLFGAKPLPEAIGPLGTNSNAIWIKIQNFSFRNIHLEMSSLRWQTLCRVGGCNCAKWLNHSAPGNIKIMIVCIEFVQYLSLHLTIERWMESALLVRCQHPRAAEILKWQFSKSYQGSWVFPLQLPSGEYHKTTLMISQHWFNP